MAGTAITLAVLAASAPVRPAAAQQTGPTLEVGTPALVDGEVHVPILTAGSGFSPYGGFQIHLRWDPALFSIASASATGGLFDPATGKAICVGPVTSTFDADGGGMIFSCSLLGGSVAAGGAEPSVSVAGPIATVVLRPHGGGCSQIHLTTVGGADKGTPTSGSYTLDASAAASLQVNQYVDGAVDTSGEPCGANAAEATALPGTTRVAATPSNATVPVEVPTQLAAGATVAPGSTPAPAVQTTTAKTPGARGTVTAGAPVLSGEKSATAAASKTRTGIIGGTSGGANGGGSNTGLIAGIAAAVVVVMGAAGGGYLYLVRRRAG